MEVLDWAYEKAITGSVPGTQDAYELANEFMKKKGSLSDQVKALVKWQNAKSATTGFVTGLGGFITLPVAIPANLASNYYIQLRMIAAIAIMGGHDVKDDRVRTVAYVCICGNAGMEILRDTGILIANKLTQQAIKKIPIEVIKKINKSVGFRLMTKGGTTGVVNLTKVVPFVGGVVGGIFDGVSTNMVGSTARKLFLESNHT